MIRSIPSTNQLSASRSILNERSILLIIDRTIRNVQEYSRKAILFGFFFRYEVRRMEKNRIDVFQWESLFVVWVTLRGTCNLEASNLIKH